MLYCSVPSFARTAPAAWIGNEAVALTFWPSLSMFERIYHEESYVARVQMEGDAMNRSTPLNPQRFQRRQFLQTVGVLAAGTFGAMLTRGEDLPENRKAAGDLRGLRCLHFMMGSLRCGVPIDSLIGIA